MEAGAQMRNSEEGGKMNNIELSKVFKCGIMCFCLSPLSSNWVPCNQSG